jgi:hypothetical protein
VRGHLLNWQIPLKGQHNILKQLHDGLLSKKMVAINKNIMIFKIACWKGCSTHLECSQSTRNPIVNGELCSCDTWSHGTQPKSCAMCWNMSHGLLKSMIMFDSSWILLRWLNVFQYNNPRPRYTSFRYFTLNIYWLFIWHWRLHFVIQLLLNIKIQRMIMNYAFKRHASF